MVLLAEETGWSLALLETPKTGFVATRPISNRSLVCLRITQCLIFYIVKMYGTKS